MKIARTLLIAVTVCVVLLIAACTLLPTTLETLHPGVLYRVANAGRTLYLTLDDGPSDATTGILDVLKKHRAPATFFVTTDHIRPELMERILADGHLLANHLKATTSLGKLSEEQFRADFVVADRALSAYPHVKLFRPPGGSMSDERAKFVIGQGYALVVGTVFPLDHWLENEAIIKTLADVLVVDGGIIILHDTPTRGPRTAAVLDGLIPELQRKGYRFALLPGPEI